MRARSVNTLASHAHEHSLVIVLPQAWRQGWFQVCPGSLDPGPQEL